MTDIGARATSRSPSQVTMRATRVLGPDGQTVIVSPRRMVPDTICPA